ncbi:pentatricopeptide repeat-containing protein At2g35030, mitochondrial [Selaginella moellendorffii]|uniref:pentatricopeptide repeat-containing protein At2g35030, mitochondrial n=1 Tax=Selaginella moellendorffii TaxID=88036 RepID=UPI000D1C501D|nr:pentatricopeptide repeat-containing protein At2g35030, mitochondrial [Selaginella moellendorffii]|eukprot:XP_024544327.1 pentatricopeptide repeat-containing protein At2g35030, mitochondrial [Selaginella moellendorffii]
MRLSLRKKWRLSPQRMMIAEAEAQDHHQSPAPPPPAATPLADASVYASLLRRCGDAGAIAEGRRVHAHIVKHGFDRDILVANSIIQMYGSCGCVDDARAVFKSIDAAAVRNVYTDTIMLVALAQNGHLQESRALFDSMVDRSSVSWNAMISAYAQSAQFEAALHLFRLMNHDGCLPDRSTFVNALGACCELTALQFGRMIHAQIAESGLERECMVATALINLHGKCGNLEGARAVFDLMEERTIISWTAMITAYSQNGQIVLARQFFDRMPHWCVISGNTLISAYSRGRNLREVQSAFDQMPVHDTTSWNLMIAAFAEAGHSQHAFDLFFAMPGGRCVVSWTTILSSCSQSRRLDDARAIFARMPQHDPISWNAMISALGHNGRIREAEELFASLAVKSVSSCNAMIVAYAESGNLEDARRIFNGMMDRSPATWGSMVLAYAQSGHVREAQRLFHSMPVKDMVAWNSLMTAFSRSEDEDERREALRVFGAMESPSSGLVPNEHSYMAVLESCGKLGALAEGREIHARIAKRGFDACDLVAASLIEMYGRCGSVDEAVAVLDQTRSLGRSVWSAAICALGQNGIGGAALGLLQRMQLQGIEVDASSTFVSLLAACSHGGMLREGVELFRSMVGDFGVEPVLEHFLCLVDLLGRAGQLDRALELVTSMPYQADAVAWVSLLSACSVHADKARGALATSSLLEIDRSDAASYCQFVFL